MRIKICSIFDCKALSWSRPVFFPAGPAAVREFGEVCNDAQSPYGKHPEDYTLFLLGEFDEQTGELFVEAAPECLARGINLLIAEDK